jgi:hypothetical protein
VVAPNFTSGTGGDIIASKHHPASDQRGWQVFQHDAGIGLYVSDDGTSAGSLTKGSCLSAETPAFITVTYDASGGDGSCIGNIYVDNLATATKTTMDGPIYNNTADFVIGNSAPRLPDAQLKGNIHYLAYYDGIVISEADHDRDFAQWQGRMGTAGNAVSVSSAAPPAVPVAPPDSGLEPFLLDQPANAFSVASHVSGDGGFYSTDAITNLVQRSSLETCTQNGDTEPDGWVVGEVAGDGSADLSCNTSTSAHMSTSAEIALTGTTSEASATSACITTGIGSDVYLSAWAKKGSGTASFRLQVLEYDAADCTSYITVSTIHNADVSSDWTKYSGTFGAGDWDGATSSYKIKLLSYRSASVIYIDAVQARVSANPTDAYCGADTDASAVCNATIHTVNNALTPDSWTIEATVSSPVDGAVGLERWIYESPGTVGSNNRVAFFWSADDLTCLVYGGAGADGGGGSGFSSTVTMDADAGEEWDVKCSKSQVTGQVIACAKEQGAAAWTCDGTPASGAYNDDMAASAYVGSDGSNPGEVWVRDLMIYRWTR